MQKRLLRWELIGFAFTGAVGTLLHFVYEWTGGDPLIAAFCAVNESTWEHMKLLFVPFFLFTMVEFIVFAEPLRSFFAAKAASILLGLLAIPVLFYSLGGMFGKTPLAFTDAGHILFSAGIMPSAEAVVFPSNGQFNQVYRVSVEGGRPTMISSMPMECISINKEGAMLYQDKKGYEDYWRKHHVSPIARDIWMYTAS